MSVYETLERPEPVQEFIANKRKDVEDHVPEVEGLFEDFSEDAKVLACLLAEHRSQEYERNLDFKFDQF